MNSILEYLKLSSAESFANVVLMLIAMFLTLFAVAAAGTFVGYVVQCVMSYFLEKKKTSSSAINQHAHKRIDNFIKDLPDCIAIGATFIYICFALFTIYATTTFTFELNGVTKTERVKMSYTAKAKANQLFFIDEEGNSREFDDYWFEDIDDYDDEEGLLDFNKTYIEKEYLIERLNDDDFKRVEATLNENQVTVIEVEGDLLIDISQLNGLKFTRHVEFDKQISDEKLKKIAKKHGVDFKKLKKSHLKKIKDQKTREIE